MLAGDDLKWSTPAFYSAPVDKLNAMICNPRRCSGLVFRAGPLFLHLGVPIIDRFPNSPFILGRADSKGGHARVIQARVDADARLPKSLCSRFAGMAMRWLVNDLFPGHFRDPWRGGQSGPHWPSTKARHFWLKPHESLG